MKPETRKKVEANIIYWMNRVDPSGLNGKMYAKLLKRLNDRELEELCSGQVPIYSPPNGKVKLDMETIYKVGEELGHVWRQRVWLYDENSRIYSLSRYKHMVTYTVIRRQTQHVEDKQSMAEHTNAIDTLTGQVSGKSKTSTFSFPQIFEHFGKGAHYSLIELLNHRGGNLEAGRALDRQIRSSGTGSLNFEGGNRTRTGATLSLGRMLTAMHLGNNLSGSVEVTPRPGSLGTEAFSGAFSAAGTVSENNGVISITGVSASTFLRLISSRWKTSRISKYLFIENGMFSRRLDFYSFFAVEVMYILTELKKDRRLPRRYYDLIDRILIGLQQNTWIRNTIDPKPLKLNYDALDCLNVPLMDSQMGFLHHWAIHKPSTMMNGILLFADPGTGKTLSGYGWSLVNDYDMTIFVVPMNSVISVWEDTILKYFKTQPKYWHSLMDHPLKGDEKYAIVHYHHLNKFVGYINKLRGKRVGVWLDESHNLNELDSKRTQLFNRMCLDVKAEGVVWASGTPLKAIGKETIPLFRSIDPMFTPEIEELFKQIFGVSAQVATDILNNRMRLTTHRIVKETVVSLDVNEETIKIKMPNSKRFTLDEISVVMTKFIKERVAYYKKIMPDIEREFHALCAKYEKENRLQSDTDWNLYLTYANQMHRKFSQREDIEKIKYCNKYEEEYFRPSLSPADRKRLDACSSIYKYVILVTRGEALGRILTRARIDCFKAMVPHAGLEELIDTARKKTIIFTSYVEVVDEINDYLLGRGYKPIVVYGETSNDLEKNLKKFKTDPDANPIIATYNSLSTAVPVIEASTAIMFNAPFRQYIFEQASSRVNRYGQDGPVDIISLVLDTGEQVNISSRSLDLQNWSKELVDLILDLNE